MMEAKDTVIQQQYPPINHEEHLKQLQRQAEISYQAGRKEVVEWLMPKLRKAAQTLSRNKGGWLPCIDKHERHTRLKEWGTMNDPTPEQIKEFWEWCGLKEVTYQRCSYHPQNVGHYWHSPDGDYLPKMPELDLNNLFKYAVPKLFAYSVHTIWRTLDLVSEWSMAEVWINTTKSYKAEHNDLALALFWAIMEVIKDE